MERFDEVNHNKVIELGLLLSGERELRWQYHNNLITDFEFIEAIRAALGEVSQPEAGMIDRNTGLKY